MRPRLYEEEKPNWEDLDPESGYFWIWEEWNLSWKLADPSWCGDDTWWLPFNALPDPSYHRFKMEYEKAKERQNKIKKQSKECAEYMKQNKEYTDFARDFLWD